MFNKELFELFNSSNVDELMRFYASLSDQEDVVKWLKSIPKSTPRIVEAGDPESNVTVIIPTPDVKNKFALNCKNSIFSGLKILFVVDNSPFFNLSHSYNYGSHLISKSKNTNWVIFSNVDMILRDAPEKLKLELNRIHADNCIIFIKESRSHSYRMRVGEYRLIHDFIFRTTSKYRRMRRMLERKYSIKINAEDERQMISKLMVRRSKSFTNIGDFSIFSIEALKRYKYSPFDETYLNGMEDVDLSLRISQEFDDNELIRINYDIGSMKSGIRGRNFSRTLKNIASLSYFNYKFSDGL